MQKLSTPRLFLRTMALAWQAHPPLAALSAVLIFLSAAIAPVQVWISKLMIDNLNVLVGQEQVNWQALLMPVALYLIIWTVSQVAESVEDLVQELMAIKVRSYMQGIVYQKAASLDIAFYETPAFYNQLELVRTGSYRVLSLVHQLAMTARLTITLVALLFLLGQINLWFPLILIFVSLPHLTLQPHFARQKANLYMNRVPEQRMMDYIGWLLTDRNAVKEIRLFQIQDYLLDRHRRAREWLFSHIAQLTFSQEKTALWLTLLYLAGAVTIWVLTGLQALAGTISLGNVALAFQTVQSIRGSFLAVGNAGGWVTEHTVYLNALFEFLDLPSDAAPGTLVHAPETAGVAADLSGPIEFKHVSFRYPDTEKLVLNDISFTIQPGEKVALVGENGSGKTTLIKLLTRLYDPIEGTVTIAGRDLRQVDPQMYYQQIGVIFQDFVQYRLTAKENVGFGNLAEIENMARIRKAAEMSGAAELIERLPHQYETVLGSYFENGQDLSGGEWQKIALARAFMRDVPLLILDEPTAALDAYAENAVYQRFAELTQGRTTMFVTHRLSSVQMAEKILVLKEGRLIETGSHDELMAQDGEYASMFRLQAERYQSPNG